MVLLEPAFVAFERLERAFGGLWVIPKDRVQRLLFQVFYLLKSVIDVKDTSSKRPDGFGGS